MAFTIDNKNFDSFQPENEDLDCYLTEYDFAETYQYPGLLDEQQNMDGTCATADGPDLTIADLPSLGDFGDPSAWAYDHDDYTACPDEWGKSGSTPPSIACESSSQLEGSVSQLPALSDELSSCRCSKKIDALCDCISEMRRQMNSLQEKLDQFAESLSAFSFDVYGDMQRRAEWREQHEGWAEKLRIRGLSGSEMLDIGQEGGLLDVD